MAVPANTVTSTDLIGIREQLADVIYNVDPEETPLFSALKKEKATNTAPEWLTETLRDSAVNAHVEGDDTALDTRAQGVRLRNYTQIFKNSVGVSGTDEALNKAGRGKQLAHELIKIGKEQRLDIEKALFDNQAYANGSGATARRLAGVPAWITTNATAGATGSNPTGDGTDARTDGTQTAFTQGKVDVVMQDIYSNSNSMKSKKVYLSPFQMDVALGFVGNNAQRNTVTAGDVTNDLVAYRTPYGNVTFQMSRECRSRDVFVLDESMWCIFQARPMKTTPLARSGDSEKRQVITELTLGAKNEKTSGIVPDNTTS